jgi:hypothetical protein
MEVAELVIVRSFALVVLITCVIGSTLVTRHPCGHVRPAPGHTSLCGYRDSLGSVDVINEVVGSARIGQAFARRIGASGPFGG